MDIEIRPHNRAAIEAHELSAYLTLIEGSSTVPDIVAQVKAQVKPGDTVMVVLDSCHSKEHVLGELEAYAPLVTKGSFIVATDGIMHWLMRRVPGLGLEQPERMLPMNMLPSILSSTTPHRCSPSTKAMSPRW